MPYRFNISTTCAAAANLRNWSNNSASSPTHDVDVGRRRSLKIDLGVCVKERDVVEYTIVEGILNMLGYHGTLMIAKVTRAAFLAMNCL